MMDLHVSLVGRTDLNGEIYRQLRQAILAGRLRPGERIPSSRELAFRLGVSRTSVAVAFERLAAEGFVTGRTGAGTFVCASTVDTREVPRDRARGALRPRPVWDSISLSSAFAAPAVFDFRTGLPDAALFPHHDWRRMLARTQRSETGIYGDPAGNRELREAIIRHLAISRGVEASADDVTITNGAQQGLDLVAKVLLSPGDRVAVEDPGYVAPRNVFSALGIRWTGVPVDLEGLVVEQLPHRARLVYVTPSHQYPLGVAMAQSRRLALLAWAEKNNAAILEDDYDSEFRFGGRPLEPLQALDTSGCVIYLGSFSKTLLPTLRIGFVVTPPSLRDAMRKAKYVADWHTPIQTQHALARFLAGGGFARHVRRVSRTYRARHAMIALALTHDLSDVLEFVPSTTGLSVAALVREGTRNLDEVVRRASAAGVEVHALSRFAANPLARPGLVFGYGAIQTGDIEEGLRRLGRAFRDL